MSITKTRQKLVEVARELFARKGLEATTMNDIAANSGKGRRTLYTYFRNKEEIYAAVIETELERLSERIDEVASIEAEPEQKVLTLIYTHLSVMEKVRRQFDEEERNILRRVLEEGIARAKFRIDNVNLMADIIHYSVKGLEVPYIYDRLGEGLTDADTRPIVMGIVRRALGMNPLT